MGTYWLSSRLPWKHSSQRCRPCWLGLNKMTLSLEVGATASISAVAKAGMVGVDEAPRADELRAVQGFFGA